MQSEEGQVRHQRADRHLRARPFKVSLARRPGACLFPSSQAPAGVLTTSEQAGADAGDLAIEVSQLSELLDSSARATPRSVLDRRKLHALGSCPHEPGFVCLGALQVDAEFSFGAAFLGAPPAKGYTAPDEQLPDAWLLHFAKHHADAAV